MTKAKATSYIGGGIYRRDQGVWYLDFEDCRTRPRLTPKYFQHLVIALARSPSLRYHVLVLNSVLILSADLMVLRLCMRIYIYSDDSMGKLFLEGERDRRVHIYQILFPYVL